MQALFDVNDVHASPAACSDMFATMSSRAALEALREATQKLGPSIEKAVSKLASLSDIAIDQTAPADTDALIEAGVVTAEPGVTAGTCNLSRVDQHVRLLSANIHAMLCAFFDDKAND